MNKAIVLAKERYVEIAKNLKATSLRGIAVWGAWILNEPCTIIEKIVSEEGLNNKEIIQSLNEIKAILWDILYGDIQGCRIILAKIADKASDFDFSVSPINEQSQAIQSFLSDFDVLLSTVLLKINKANEKDSFNFTSDALVQEKDSVIDDLGAAFICAVSMHSNPEFFIEKSYKISKDLKTILPWDHASILGQNHPKRQLFDDFPSASFFYSFRNEPTSDF